MLDQQERAAACPTRKEALGGTTATQQRKPQAPDSAPGTRIQPLTQQKRQQDSPPPREPTQTTQETSALGPISQRSVSPTEGADHASQGTMPEPHGQVLPADPADGEAHGTLMGPLKHSIHVDEEAAEGMEGRRQVRIGKVEDSLELSSLPDETIQESETSRPGRP
jgi:hypothetical protein